MCGFMTIGVALGIAFSAIAAEAPLGNAGFEEMSAEGALEAWRFHAANACNGGLEIDREVKAEGNQSVRLWSDSAQQPHVYIGISQTLAPLETGVTYIFRFKAKGENVGQCWYGGGPGWSTRQGLPRGTFDWREFELDWQAPEGVAAFEFRVNVDSTTRALWVDDVRVETKVPDPQAGAKALALVAEQEARLSGVEERLNQAKADGLPVHYPQADFLTARMFCRFCRDDVEQGRTERALSVANEVRTLLDRAEREMRDGIAVPVFVPGTLRIGNGSFWGTCRTGGTEEDRPVFFTGYGHFGRAANETPLMAQLGLNFIQIEMGPRSVVNETGEDLSQFDGFIVDALDRARDNGVAVCLLISPHYFPQWAFDKWPEIQSGNGFLKNTLDAPQVRDIYERFLRAIIPRIKGHPALHSICLTNEPVSLGSADDPFRLPLWHDYLRRRHGDVAKVNTLYGTHYGAIDDVPHPRLSFDEQPIPLYDAVQFNQERFAEWHKWMVDIIHEMAPEIPCHAKVMALPNGRDSVFWGTDPWQFAQLSQVNGNDCYFLPNTGDWPWQSMWWIQNIYYDLQRSMALTPVVNTENHIIPDRYQREVAPSHIYSSIWQGAIHGLGGSATWCWERTYDSKADFEGLILHRAACTAAMNRVSLDLMRLSREMAALQNVPPRVAILWSDASTVHDPRHHTMRNKVYVPLDFCGVPVGYVTEEQIAAGVLDRYDCLVVAGARALMRDAVAPLAAFRDNGGAVVAYGSDCLAVDEYLQPLEGPAPSETIADAEPGPALAREFEQALARAGVLPAVALVSPEGAPVYGVEWRCAELDGRALVNMTNLTRDAVEVRLPEGEWVNLLTRDNLSRTVLLEPNAPILAASKIQ